MKDVAQDAGVSVGTVSNVLNRPERVAPATRSRVLAAIERLGYVRSESARQLRAGRSRMLALLVLDLANPFFVAVAKGASAAAREAGLGVMVCHSAQSAAEEAEYVGMFAEHRVRGVLVTPVDATGLSLAPLRRQGIPYVCVDRPGPVRPIVAGSATPQRHQPPARRAAPRGVAETPSGDHPEGAPAPCDAPHRTPRPVRPRSTGQTLAGPGEAACSVSVDDHAGAALAVGHLVARGHRRVAYVNGPLHLTQCRDRLTGALSVAPHLTVLDVPRLDVAAGRDAGARLLGLMPRPTALFCANDLIALGVLQTLHTAGLRVPDDLALVGYDDIEFAAAAAVPLTSVRKPAFLMGRRAVRLLLSEADPDHVHERVVFPPELTIRRSSGPG
jgi:LacI family transcriptional regulator